MAGSANSGRERNYLADEEERIKRAKAFGTKPTAGPRVGALASMRPSAMGSQSAQAAPEAPTDIGQLATPSTMGRESPPSSPEEFNQRVARNEGFLSSPETRAALLQFGISLMSTAGRGNIGSNIGQALGHGLQASGRVRLGQEAATAAEAEAFRDERKMQLEEDKFDLDRLKVGMEVGELQRDFAKQERRRKLFGAVAGNSKDISAMSNMEDVVLLDLAGQLAADGDEEGMKMAVELANSRRLATSTNDIVEWRQAVQDGSFDGGYGEWTLRPKAPTMKIENTTQVGSKLDDNIMKAAIEDSKAADDLMSQSQELALAADIAKKTPTGYLVPWTLPIRSALLDAGFVWNQEDEANISIQQVLQSQSNQLALRMRNPDSGFGLTGNTSNQDIVFLLNTVANLGNTPEANVATLTILQAKQRRKADIARARADYAFEHGTLKGWSKVSQELFTGDDAPSMFTDEEMLFLDSLSNPERTPMIGSDVPPIDPTPAPVESQDAPVEIPEHLSEKQKELWHYWTEDQRREVLQLVPKPE